LISERVIHASRGDQHTGTWLGPQQLITHCFALDQFEEAVEVRRSDPSALKVIIEPQPVIEAKA